MENNRVVQKKTPEQFLRENAHSVLIRRAVLFALSLFLIAVIVGAPVFHLVDRATTLSNAKAAMVGVLNSAAANMADADVPHDDYITGLTAQGLTTTLIRGVGTGNPDEYEDEDELLAAILEGDRYYTIHRDGREYLRGVTACESGNSVIVVDMDISKVAGSRFASLFGLIAGFIAACLAGVPLLRLLPVKALSAVEHTVRRVGEGDFEAKADESAPGEIGTLAAAVNGVSAQLSRNMYMLIVERNRLKHMLDGLSEGIVAIDTQGAVTVINPPVASMFEQRRISVGLADPRMKHIPDKSVWEDFDRVLETGESITRNFNYRDAVIRMIISPIVDELNVTAGAVGLFSDVTQLERLERTRREYVSNVSHELRTPLTAVRGLVEPLKDGLVTSEQDRMRYYDIILREVMRLSRLINDQLELSRLQSGNVAIEKARVALDDLLYDVCERYGSIAEEKGLELKVADLSECPSVWGNADRIEEMFIILLDNAIKYTEEGSVSVLAEWDDEKVSISVRDTGIGIAEEDLPYVFDRFYKVDKAHSGKGSGLGLSILTELCKRMNEEISVDSVKGEGSTFTFTVHREPPKEDDGEPADAE